MGHMEEIQAEIEKRQQQVVDAAKAEGITPEVDDTETAEVEVETDSVDETEVDSEDEDDTEDDDTEDTDEVDESDVESLQAEITRLKESLSKANRNKRAAERKSKTAVTTADVEKWKGAATTKTIHGALKDAGFIAQGEKAKAQLARALKLMDLTDVYVDDDGDITGFEDQIAELKEDMPHLFRDEETATKATRKTPSQKVNTKTSPTVKTGAAVPDWAKNLGFDH